MKSFTNFIPVDGVGHDHLPAGTLFLDLAGPLRLTDASGSDLTPALRKAQGLLALIGTAPGFRRSRTWLQDKLWSDRDPAQGASSLRQCLRRLRSTLGRHADCLKAGPGWIAFDPARIHVRIEPDPADVGETSEFLEGLDIGDPEFEDWLRDQRMSYAARSGPSATRPLERPADTLHMTQRNLGAPFERNHYDAMVAVAALAGYLTQRRNWPQCNGRLAQNDLSEALRGRHVAHAHEVVRALGAFLVTRSDGAHRPAIRPL